MEKKIETEEGVGNMKEYKIWCERCEGSGKCSRGDVPDCPDCEGAGYQLKELFEKDPDQGLPENPYKSDAHESTLGWIARSNSYKDAQQDMKKEGWVKCLK